jgi:hypothetical protein
MERKRLAIQGTADFGLSGHPYSNQILLPVSSAGAYIEFPYSKILTLSQSSHAQRRAMPGSHYNMMVRDRCNAVLLC